MRVQKITNPVWLGAIAPQISDFAKKIDIKTIDYETLYSYFVQSIQYGGENTEFVVVINDDDKPVAFAHWMVRGLPHRGSVYCDFIYSWASKEAVDAIIGSFSDFAAKHRCVYLEGDFINEKLVKHFSSVAEKHGYDFEPLKHRSFLARKKA